MHVKRPYPPKLRDIPSWTFPTDYPVVPDSAASPDATKTLKEVIEYTVKNYYWEHRIFTHDLNEFNRHFANRLYNLMLQHQYVIDQFLLLIAQNQLFYNDETQNLSRSSSNTATGLSKESDTPQNMVSDISTYLTAATATDDSNSGTDTQTNTFHKSTLGDITVQFNNFTNFPNFTTKLITAVAPCFIMTYTEDYDIPDSFWE